MNPADNRKMALELQRIQWRREMMGTPEGLARLVANARRREQDVGPHAVVGK